MADIISLRYQNEIQNTCTYLPKIGLRYFVMYIIFNDGSKFVLSNIFHMLESYYAESLYKEDYNFRLTTIANLTHYFCDSMPAVSDKFKQMLEERYGVYRAYYIVRECPECTFVFGAIKDTNFDSSNLIYKDTLEQFENFCADFSNHFIELIINYNCSYRNSFVLTNQSYRKAVIKRGYFDKENLTGREKECLIWASRGKSTKEISKILKISPHTVATHSKKIKEKLNCSTMVEAIIEGVHRGIIGSINQWNHFDSSTMGSFKIIKNMDAARKEIAKTSLVLFNSV